MSEMSGLPISLKNTVSARASGAVEANGASEPAGGSGYFWSA